LFPRGGRGRFSSSPRPTASGLPGGKQFADRSVRLKA
jgi:hypothetical protein